MTEEDMTSKVEEMIQYMKTDDYWLERGGNGPYWAEGGKLLEAYLKSMDEKGVERKDTLIVPFNQTLNKNLSKPHIINRTTTNSVKAILMSGVEYEASLIDVATFQDLRESVIEVMGMEGKIEKRIRLVIGERVLERASPRAILTDDTVLTIVVLA